MAIQITTQVTQAVSEIDAELLVVGCWTLPRGAKAPKSLADLDKKLGGILLKCVSKEEFSGKPDEQLVISTGGKITASKLILLGLGDRRACTVAGVRGFAGRAARLANAEKVNSLAVVLPDDLGDHPRHLAEGIELGAYRFTKYLTAERKPQFSLKTVALISEKKFPADTKKQVALAQGIALGVNVSRDLSNEPPNVIYPKSLADAAVAAGKAHGFKVVVFDEREIEKRGMHLLQAVGRGSARPPRLVHMSYVPGKAATERLAFVGKGVTFDSGGLSIKPAQGMGEMKHDMSGAANVLGLMIAISALKPSVEVHGFMACAENMPDGGAYRPGDIFGSLDGKTVEIINTDAEGRLVLADALTYAASFQPHLLVDNATLTGACVVALGTQWSAFYATNEKTRGRFAEALATSGEQMWHMPLVEEYREQLKSDSADLKHTGDRWGGSITAGLFLKEFIGATENWVHCDIAGPASTERPYAWNVKGATGHGVLTFLALVENAGEASGR